MTNVLLKLEIRIAGKSGDLESFLSNVESSPKPEANEFCSQVFVNNEDEFTSVYTSPNRELLAWIRSNQPKSVSEMAKNLGRTELDLSQTLRTLAKFSLVRLEEGNTASRTLRPFVDWEQLEVRFPEATRA